MWQEIINNILQLLTYDPQEPLLFTSAFFVGFFFILLSFYQFILHKVHARTWYLLLFSLYFYYKTSGIFLVLLLTTAFINFVIGAWIDKSSSLHKKRTLLIISMFWNLGTLGYYKYTNFLVNTFNDLFRLQLPPQDIFLPIGISFFTFQTMSYTIDIYQGKLKPLDRFEDLCFFVAFFPHLVAGPIVKASYFIPQIRQKITLNQDQLIRALILIMGGLFKKGIIADYISSNFVDRVFDNPTLFSGLENLFAVYGYALQIYCDFSGYSDMAIGVALLLGFSLGENFNLPYRAASVTEFWRRWHISLSTWLRDYLYIPLGGNRKGKIRTNVNLFATMLLGGLWHGASWNFVFWGGLHGTALVLDKFWLRLNIKPTRFTHWLGVIFTFHFVCLSWIFFRANSFEVSRQILIQIFTNFQGAILLDWIKGYRIVAALMGLGFFLHFAPHKLDEWTQTIMLKMPIIVQSAVLAFFIWIYLQVRSADIQPFIYFQF